MKSKPQILGLFCAAALAVYSGPVKWGDAATSADQPDGKPAGTGIRVTGTQMTARDNGTIEIHVNDTPLPEVLRMLPMQSHLNIIAGKNVTD